MGLVGKIRPELTFKLAELVSLDPSQTLSIRNKATDIANRAAGQILNSYKIDIYYDKTSGNDKNTSKSIKLMLEAENIGRKVILAPKPKKWLQKVGAARGFEVRYEPNKEDDAAMALISTLKKIAPSLVFNSRRVVNKTPGTLSIFIFSFTK